MLITATLTSRSARLNLELEEKLLLAQKNPRYVYLLFYENQSSIILGKSLVYEEEVFSHKNHPPVLRRISGGGTVYHDYGNLNYSLMLSLDTFPEFFPIGESYHKILGGLKCRMTPRIQIRGISDLVLDCGATHRKISGNSQCRKRGWLMQHGTFVYESALLKKIPYYLKIPPKIPEYRAARSHTQFMSRTLPYHSRYVIQNLMTTGLAETFNKEIRRINFDKLLSAR